MVDDHRGGDADGWIVPGTAYLSRDDLVAKQKQLDQAAAEIGRDPAAIGRIVDLGGVVEDGPVDQWLHGPVEPWIEEVAHFAAEGFDTVVFWPDQATDEQLHAFAKVATAVRNGSR